MNINFKTHFPWCGADGLPEPTRFKEQILQVLVGADGQAPFTVGGKMHTIRRVKSRPRFRAGMKLVLQTGSRFKPEPFAETVCTGVQLLKMSIRRIGASEFIGLRVELNGLPLIAPQVEDLMANDGLNFDQFTKWFLLDVITRGPGEYELVHWTDHRY